MWGVVYLESCLLVWPHLLMAKQAVSGDDALRTVDDAQTSFQRQRLSERIRNDSA
jgi:hypothetical protein